MGAESIINNPFGNVLGGQTNSTQESGQTGFSAENIFGRCIQDKHRTGDTCIVSVEKENAQSCQIVCLFMKCLTLMLSLYFRFFG
jgi:hypothetical protein